MGSVAAQPRFGLPPNAGFFRALTPEITMNPDTTMAQHFELLAKPTEFKVGTTIASVALTDFDMARLLRGFSAVLQEVGHDLSFVTIQMDGRLRVTQSF